MVVRILYACLLAQLTILYPSPAAGQTSDDVSFVLDRISGQPANPEHTNYSARLSSNEISFAGLSIVRLYQRLISSQDKPSCMFSVSCSNFAIQAIGRKGIVLGILLASDRIQRCNGLVREVYETDPQTLRAIDPVLTAILREKD